MVDEPVCRYAGIGGGGRRSGTVGSVESDMAAFWGGEPVAGGVGAAGGNDLAAEQGDGELVCAVPDVFYVCDDELCALVIIMEECESGELFSFVLCIVIVGGFGIHGGSCIKGIDEIRDNQKEESLIKQQYHTQDGNDRPQYLPERHPLLEENHRRRDDQYGHNRHNGRSNPGTGMLHGQ